jgi:hypothetical protein
MLRMFRLVGETEDLLINAWRTRKWATFIRVWLLASVAMVPVTFVMTFILLYIPFLVYNVLISVAALIFGGTPTLVGPSLDVLFSTFAVLSFPKIQSGKIRAVRQNQRIIRCDVCDHSPCNVHSRSVQATTPA